MRPTVRAFYFYKSRFASLISRGRVSRKSRTIQQISAALGRW